MHTDMETPTTHPHQSPVFTLRSMEAFSRRDPVAAMDDILNLFTPREAMRLAYGPIILSRAAFIHIAQAHRIAAALRLPYAKQFRQIDQAVHGLRLGDERAIENHRLLETLERHTRHFLTHAGGDMQTFWFVVNQDLKTQRPELETDDYAFATSLLVAAALMAYRDKLQAHYVNFINRKLGVPRAYDSDNDTTTIISQLLGILGNKYSIKPTTMWATSLQILDNKLYEVINTIAREAEQEH